MNDTRFPHFAAAAPHLLAAESGRAVMAEGGNAVEAMLAMAATIAVVYPHMNSLGGDGFWLIADAKGRVRSIEACGGAGAKATIGLYREKGYDTIPSRGPLAALTVPGAVGGFGAGARARDEPRRTACRSATSSAMPSAWRAKAVPVSPSMARNEPSEFEELDGGARLRRRFPRGRQAAASGRDTAGRRRSPTRSRISRMPASRISIAAMSGARSVPILPPSAAR